MGITKEKNVSMTFPARLQRAAKMWLKYSQPMLKKRARMVRAWLSNYHSDSADVPTHTMNLLDRGLGIIVPYLSMSNPKIHCEARIPDLKPWAYTTQLAMNHLIEEIKFSTTVMRPLIFNSMFGAGIIKSGIMGEGHINYFGNQLEVGQPYAAVIDDEDYIGDVSATAREGFDMEGHVYRLPTEFAKEFFGRKYADHIKPDFKLWGDDDMQRIAKHGMSLTEQYTLKGWSQFMDIYLPDEGITLTIMPEGKLAKILRTVEWDGPEDGPFDFLGYKFAPKSPMPVPPCWGWIDMDTTINILINKMREQAEAQKSVLVYEAAAADDAERIAKTGNQGSCRVDNINMLDVKEFGGVNPQNYDYVNYIENQFSVQGGNLYTVGGRASGAKTLGQEQMLQNNATRIIDDMVNSVYNIATSVFKKMAWHIWSDPLIQIPMIKRIPGAGSVDVVFDQYAKEGDFYDFNFKIQPYSMQRFNPNIQHQKLIQLLTAWIVPMAGMAAQQGVTIDIDAATKKIAEYMQIDIGDIWKTAVPDAVGMGPYQPMQGSTKGGFGQSDDRFGGSGGSSESNLIQHQSSPRAGQPSPPQK